MHEDLADMISSPEISSCAEASTAPERADERPSKATPQERTPADNGIYSFTKKKSRHPSNDSNNTSNRHKQSTSNFTISDLMKDLKKNENCNVFQETNMNVYTTNAAIDNSSLHATSRSKYDSDDEN